jgi:D-aminopeptidase
MLRLYTSHMSVMEWHSLCMPFTKYIMLRRLLTTSSTRASSPVQVLNTALAVRLRRVQVMQKKIGNWKLFTTCAGKLD